MQYTTLLLGLIPLILFVIVDIFAGLKTALVVAIVMAILEGMYCYFFIGTLDYITIIIIITLIGFGSYSYFSKSSTPFKMQPVLLSSMIGLALLISFYIGKPLLPYLFERYSMIIPKELHYQVQHPLFIRLITLATHYSGYAFLAHAAATAYAALKLSNWWWLIIRSLGLYISMFIGIMLARIHMMFF